MGMPGRFDRGCRGRFDPAGPPSGALEILHRGHRQAPGRGVRAHLDISPKETFWNCRPVRAYTPHLHGAHARVPVGKFKIGQIAQERKHHLTNKVIGDLSSTTRSGPKGGWSHLRDTR